MEKNNLIRILIVDDDMEDIDLLLELLKDETINIEVDSKPDGIYALKYLQKLNSTDRNKLPHLIFLDLNMPRKGGLEVLHELKRDNVLNQIPVIVFTTSSSENDIKNAYSNGANCYIQKPSSLKKFSEIINAIKNFWMNTVVYPSI